MLLLSCTKTQLFENKFKTTNSSTRMPLFWQYIQQQNVQTIGRVQLCKGGQDLVGQDDPRTCNGTHHSNSSRGLKEYQISMFCAQNRCEYERSDNREWWVHKARDGPMKWVKPTSCCVRLIHHKIDYNCNVHQAKQHNCSLSLATKPGRRLIFTV